jgi:hypothetical protein
LGGRCHEYERERESKETSQIGLGGQAGKSEGKSGEGNKRPDSRERIDVKEKELDGSAITDHHVADTDQMRLLSPLITSLIALQREFVHQ